MKKLIAICSLTLMSSLAFSAVECTKEPKGSWQNEEQFKKGLGATYKIKNFKVTSGNCYEIYGWNKENKKVEIYFNPVTGKIVKENISK